jgi:hypothetical protein
MNGSLSSITPRRIVVIVVSLVMIVAVGSIGMLEHHAQAAQHIHDIGMVDQATSKLPVDTVQQPPCDDHMSTARCNDMRHFGTPGVALSHSNDINEAKCNDMRHFGSFADQPYSEVCQPQQASTIDDEFAEERN